MAEDSGDKTEEPTPHKLSEARKKGQITKSKEVTSAFGYIAAYVALRSVAQPLWDHMVNLSHYVFGQLPYVTTSQGGFTQEILVQSMISFVLAIGPLFGVVFMVSLFAEFLQTGGMMSVESISPKLEKLTPIEGFKKMFAMKGLVTLIINLVKIFLVFWISFKVLMDKYPLIITTVNSNLWLTMGFVGDIVFTIAMRIGVFYIAVAAFDYLFQRFEFMKQMKMSKQEVKEEYKRLEGDPQIKRRMREMQREMSQGRMMGNVPKSDVVVTNPTHLAVALKYDSKEMRSPIVLAKGQRKQAAEIRRIAEEHFIPIVENRSLARALYKLSEIGQEIPYELYKAVAEVLAFVYNLKKKRRGF